MMEQVKTYKYIIAGLTILNLGILSFLLLNKPGTPRHHPDKHRLQTQIIDLLQLDDAQEIAFKKMADEHGQKIKTIQDQEKILAEQYFKTLIVDPTDNSKDLIMSRIQTLETEKLSVTYDHFKELRNILTKDQLTQFPQFLNLTLDKILSPNANMPPRRKFEHQGKPNGNG